MLYYRIIFDKAFSPRMRIIKAWEDYPYIGCFSAYIKDKMMVSECIYINNPIFDKNKKKIYEKILQDVQQNNSKSATIGLFFTRHFYQE